VNADGFDHYLNPLLTKVPEAAGVKELKRLPAEAILENGGIIPNKYTSADPKGVSPRLTWTNVPANTVTFALIFHVANRDTRGFNTPKS
jgi:phosphatidylethanolamine-binding protein (PEBP) family uncharacterized protein